MQLMKKKLVVLLERNAALETLVKSTKIQVLNTAEIEQVCLVIIVYF
jgi:hypothetical protein